MSSSLRGSSSSSLALLCLLSFSDSFLFASRARSWLPSFVRRQVQSCPPSSLTVKIWVTWLLLLLSHDDMCLVSSALLTMEMLFITVSLPFHIGQARQAQTCLPAGSFWGQAKFCFTKSCYSILLPLFYHSNRLRVLWLLRLDPTFLPTFIPFGSLSLSVCVCECVSNQQDPEER